MEILQNALQSLPIISESDNKLSVAPELLGNDDDQNKEDLVVDPVDPLDRLMCDIVDNL